MAPEDTSTGFSADLSSLFEDEQQNSPKKTRLSRQEKKKLKKLKAKNKASSSEDSSKPSTEAKYSEDPSTGDDSSNDPTTSSGAMENNTGGSNDGSSGVENPSEELTESDSKSTSKNPDSTRETKSSESAKQSVVAGTSEELTQELDSSEAIDTSEEAEKSSATKEPSSTGDQDNISADKVSKEVTSGANTSTAEDNSGAGTESDVIGWTKSLDALLVSMKEGDETWATIAQTLHMPKKDVRARYKELTASVSSQPSGKDNEKAVEGDKENGVKHKKAQKSRKTDKSKKTDKSEKTEKDKSKVSVGPKKTDAKVKSTKGPKKAKGPSPKTEDKTKRNGRKETALKTSRVLFERRRKQTGNLAGDGETFSDVGSIHSKVTVPPAQCPYRDADDDSDSDIAQANFAQKIHEELYPPYLSYQPDREFTERDCRILATIDSKMKRSRWLEIQANFCNAGGIMVPIEALKRKTEEAEALQAAKEKAERVQSWAEELHDETADPYETQVYVRLSDDGDDD